MDSEEVKLRASVTAHNDRQEWTQLKGFTRMCHLGENVPHRRQSETSNQGGATMLEEDMEVAIKVVVVGNGAVGKSSMIQRYCKGVFTKDYKKTIGVDFLERQIIVNDEDVRLMLWDTAGQEEFDAITKAYYRGAQACVLVFSTTDRDSFLAIDNWKEKIEAEVGDIPTVLVQNKIDLLEESVIKNEEAEGLAKRLKFRFYRASVKEDLNVTEVFKYLAEKYLQQLKQQTAEETEALHSTSNKIGVFNTTSSNQSNQSSTNGREVITLRPNKQRTKKSKNPFGSCSLL
ncbi:ras-related protein Rab-23 isoform X1 [Phyllopteryx taeniolatus]|uniref:ras-related protein Rab-23 isoform X1 n=2 Tax=Phyllopteryx taeniolatus TaxID=161469 RepID=UPI002AD288F7|nr:ras-related protein Rab-23 isoform X1 [Phyllopteryx taeniolatus]